MTGETRMFKNILYSLREGIAAITINRPAVRNALNRETIEELAAACAQAKGDDGVRAIVLTGAGDKAFAAGADIGEIAAQSSTSAVEYARRGQMVFDSIEDLGKP